MGLPFRGGFRGDSVWDSVWDSMGGAYISSFFDIPKWKGIKHKKGSNPFQSCITLWEKGLVPSFDGENMEITFRAQMLRSFMKYQQKN